MIDLGSVGLSYTPRIPCNDTLYQLWKTQPSYSSDYEDTNSCLNYDYPQDGGVGPSASAKISTTATTTPGSSESTRVGGSTSDATTSSSPTQSTETATESANGTETATPNNGAGQSFATSLIGCALTVMSLTLVNFC
ncbi:hypothetical protein N7478_011687 [Penicillium angulare]|uniref:uncharacterized protein n=1 Tax=Penicillium angulare TaxID=116970 RepID=UPI0025405B3B|nr:uncharacterized protein N7478_011687 [Penicillium angulare]KAJ5261092.1 hypothetical protein N7478_011687 [Penicillium angulare]